MTEASTIVAMSKKEVAATLGVTEKTLRAWVHCMLSQSDAIKKEFGAYTGRKYTPRQVRMIFSHVGHTAL